MAFVPLPDIQTPPNADAMNKQPTLSLPGTYYTSDRDINTGRVTCTI
jgi:hypothetical protein